MNIYYIRTLQEAENLSEILSQDFPNPSSASLGLLEIMLNAIEHGNLNLHSHKHILLKSGLWHEEIAKRLSHPENIQKKVSVILEKTLSSVYVTIEDEGEGFAWEQYLNCSPDDLKHYHGRGIMLSRLLSFDDMRYDQGGSRVVCEVKIKDKQSSHVL